MDLQLRHAVERLVKELFLADDGQRRVHDIAHLELVGADAGGDDLVAHGGDNLMDVIPMAAYQVLIEALPEERSQLPVSGAGLESIELPVRKPGDARLKAEAEQMHHREYDVGHPAAIDMKSRDFCRTLMAENPVERMDGLACGAGNHSLMERCVTVRNGGVNLDDRITAIMGVDGATAFTWSTEVEMLAISGSPPALPKPCRHWFGMNGVCECTQGSAKCVFAHMPGLHPEQRPSRGDPADVGHAR